MTLDKLGGSTRGPIVQSFCIKTIAELVSKQHWSELKTRLISTKPAELLDQLLDAGVDSKLVLRFFQWSQRELKLSYGLETTGKVLHSLVKSKCYSKHMSEIWKSTLPVRHLGKLENMDLSCLPHHAILC
ncbi:hypothetical protein AAHE18_13G087200 [Arachis hypogaea]